ncbi:unannotated protein [freshwater metagenome]|uniref:Unannotated protein n=1 Tax=freshwater metagenome TaxID=449393 RepID=A0A6J5YIR5_9ZZZZ
MGGDVVLERFKSGAANQCSHGTGRRFDRDHCRGDPLGIGFSAHRVGEGRVVGILGGVLSHWVKRGPDLEATTEHTRIALFVGGTHSGIGEKLLFHLFDEIAIRRWLGDGPAGSGTGTGPIGATPGGQRNCVELLGLGLGDHVVRHHASQSDVSASTRSRRVHDRIELNGIRDDRRQQGALRPRERLDVLSPVGLSGGLDPIRARTEIHGVEIQLENLILR